MLDVSREISSSCEVFTIKNSTGSLKIFYFYNMELCWSIDDKNDSDICSIEIDPGDLYFYTLIEEIYDSVFNNQPFKHLKYDFDAKNLEFKDQNSNSKRLFKDGVIEWHSDDCIYNNSSVLYIRKDLNKYCITFKKSKGHTDRIYPFTDYTVVFSNNSRYSPYNVTFMNMFNKLREYDYYVNQVNLNSYSSDNQVKVRKRDMD